MTDNKHPITPPPELVKEWATANGTIYKNLSVFCQNIATQAARWGADQEVGACCQWLSLKGYDLVAAKFRAARRPKPLSLKEQAKQALGRFFANEHTQASQMTRDFEIIRRALESLPD